MDVAIDQSGNVYVADAGCHSIRLIEDAGFGQDLAGWGEPSRIRRVPSAPHFRGGRPTHRGEPPSRSGRFPPLPYPPPWPSDRIPSRVRRSKNQPAGSRVDDAAGRPGAESADPREPHAAYDLGRRISPAHDPPVCPPAPHTRWHCEAEPCCNEPCTRRPGDEHPPGTKECQDGCTRLSPTDASAPVFRCIAGSMARFAHGSSRRQRQRQRRRRGQRQLIRRRECQRRRLPGRSDRPGADSLGGHAGGDMPRDGHAGSGQRRLGSGRPRPGASAAKRRRGSVRCGHSAAASGDAAGPIDIPRRATSAEAGDDVERGCSG